jgi:hypothetical protein
MGTPAGLYYLLGILMLALAAYGLVLLLTSVLDRRSAGRDVETSHVAMGVSMAGMFVPAWAFGPSALWELIFVVLLVWFVVRSIQSIQHWGLHVPHTAIHAVMSFAMLLMYWFPAPVSPHSGSMSMMAGATRLDPGLAFVTAFVLFGSAIFTIASPNRGATHFGTHQRTRPGSDGIAVGPARSTGFDTRGAVTTHPGGLDATIGRPALLDASHVLMAVAMGLMLILMI